MQSILQQYNIPTNSTITPIHIGLINATYKVVTPYNEAYILQKINTKVFTKPDAIAHNIATVAEHIKLHNTQYLLPTPIALPNGMPMLEIDTNYYRLFHFVSNSHSKQTLQNPEQAYEAAFAFGNFTYNCALLPLELLQVTIPNFHNLTLRYTQYENAIQQNPLQRVKAITTEINYLQNNKAIVAQYQAMLHNKNFVQRVTHHDTKISNVLFNDNDKSICVIDLDTVMPGYFISDLGDMFRTYLTTTPETETDLSKIKIDVLTYQAIVAGYTKGMCNTLSAHELKYIHYSGEYMIYMQALRFVTDYINGDVYYPINYPTQNLDRAKNQMELLRQFKMLV